MAGASDGGLRERPADPDADVPMAGGWALCLLWAASAAALPPDTGGAPPTAHEAVHSARHVTLAWMHTIERTRWEEHYDLVGPDDTDGPCAPVPHGALCPRWVRVQGSGAGMEPAPHATWRDGGYEWAPPALPVTALRLMRSPHAADYTLCLDAHCRPLTAWLPQTPPPEGVVRLRVCPATGVSLTPAPATKTSG
jgi:hypothetical protein